MTNQQTKTDIEDKNNILPDLPESSSLILTDLQATADNDTIPELPITQQEKVQETINFLHQHYNFKSLPDFLLQLPPLPKPSWEIF